MFPKFQRVVITVACLMMIKNIYECSGIGFGDFMLCCLITTFYIIDLWDY